MITRNTAKREAIADYTMFYIESPQYPDIERFIYRNRKAVYINLSAKPGANIVKLVF